jgi:hypothetical protein
MTCNRSNLQFWRRNWVSTNFCLLKVGMLTVPRCAPGQWGWISGCDCVQISTIMCGWPLSIPEDTWGGFVLGRDSGLPHFSNSGESRRWTCGDQAPTFQSSPSWRPWWVQCVLLLSLNLWRLRPQYNPAEGLDPILRSWVSPDSYCFLWFFLRIPKVTQRCEGRPSHNSHSSTEQQNLPCILGCFHFTV